MDIEIPNLRASSSGSGTYVRLRIEGPWLRGDNKTDWKCFFWASSSSVHNYDGNPIYISWSYDGGKTEAGNSHLTTLTALGSYSEGSPWSTTKQLSPSGNTIHVRLRTWDNLGDSRFKCDTGWISYTKGTQSMEQTSSTGTTCTVRFTYNTKHDEDMTYNDRGQFKRIALSTGSSSTSFSVTRATNYSETFTAGLTPNGTDGPWQNGSVKCTLRTSFTEMSMPTITSVVRDSNDPTKLIVTWTGGGTTNKPSGGVSRSHFLIVRKSEDPSSAGNIAVTQSVNMESNGTYTFSNIPTDRSITIFMEYRVDGLASTHYQKSNMVVLESSFAMSVKTGGTYKRSTEAYVKVGGSYKRITEGYIKVGGAYKKLV